MGAIDTHKPACTVGPRVYHVPATSLSPQPEASHPSTETGFVPWRHGSLVQRGSRCPPDPRRRRASRHPRLPHRRDTRCPPMESFAWQPLNEGTEGGEETCLPASPAIGFEMANRRLAKTRSPFEVGWWCWWWEAGENRVTSGMPSEGMWAPEGRGRGGRKEGVSAWMASILPSELESSCKDRWKDLR